MKENKNYCTPIVEVPDARVERGYQSSEVPPTPVTPEEGGFNAGGYTGWTDGGNTNGWFT